MKWQPRGLGRYLGLVPFLPLAPLIAVKSVLTFLAESPRLLLGVILGMSMGLVAADMFPGDDAAAARPGEQAYRLSEHVADLSVAARPAKDKRLNLKRKGPNLVHPALPAWNWVGPMTVRPKLPKHRKLWPWLPSVAPDKGSETCLWAHPLSEGKLYLHFRDVPLGGRMVGFVHFLRTAAKDAGVKIAVKRGRKTLRTLRPEAHPGGAWDFELDLPGEGTGAVTLVVQPIRRGKNHICLDALVEAPADE